MNTKLISLLLGTCLSILSIAAAHAEAAVDHDKTSPVALLDRCDPAYKLVLDLNSASPSPGEVNPGLVAVSGLVKLFQAQGAKSSAMRIVVVIHGAATDVALRSEAYRRKANGQGNPNLSLVQELADAGVVFAVSGPSMTSRNIAQKDIAAPVRIGPAADLIFFKFEENGYIYTGAKGLLSD